MTRKFERQAAILRLVQQQPLSTQAEVAEALRAERDRGRADDRLARHHELGLVKVRDATGGSSTRFRAADCAASTSSRPALAAAGR